MTISFPPDKKEAIEALLAQPVLARLGTAGARSLQPHVVPVWFVWDGEAAWVSAFSSTRKLKDVVGNPRAALLIEAVKPAGVEAVLLEGPVEVIQEPRELVRSISMRIYAAYMGEEGAAAPEPVSWSVDPENRLIKLIPRRVFAW